MCGIVGIYDLAGPREVDPGLLVRMNNRLTHRGPDEADIFLADGLGLGHRRLSIIDLKGGQQPLFNEDRSVVVVFNGEIFNFQELARDLQGRGHRFRSQSDTEVIVHGWEEWGPDCVHKFRGQFVFALWDSNKRELFLARDRLGIKPLYYTMTPGGRLYFGSELKALLAVDDIARELDPAAIEDYFAYGYVPDPKTIYRNIHKLAPGHLLRLARGNPEVRPRSYWDVPFEPVAAASEDALGEELIERLREAVKIRMIADVPLGAFLSGGVDSSAVVALMAQANEGAVDTCSIGFDHEAFDETGFAAQVAEQYKTRHVVRRVKSDALDLVDRLADIYDEPFADSSAMPTYRVCGLARERVTVALSGDGGDEIFAGYRRYRWHHYEEMVRGRMPSSVSAPLFGALGRLYPKLDWAPKVLRAKSTFQALSRDTVGGYFHSVSVVPDPLRHQLFSRSFETALGGYHAEQVVRDWMNRAPTSSPVGRVQYADMKTYLPGDILTKVDRASMAHSLEVRVPLLDHKFLEWASGIPTRLALNGREGKYIFKKALERHLPRGVLYREKMGFAVPLAKWFRGDLSGRLEDCMTDSVLRDTGMFDMDMMATLVRHHLQGIRDHSSTLWSVLMFDSFLRNVHDRRDHSAEPHSGHVVSEALAAS